MKKIKVLIIDDSAVIRRLVADILSADEEIEVIGTAADAYIAREKIKALNPDVITLDVEMPKMDGITFLKNLMRLRPMPVVMLSTFTSKGAGHTLEALNSGAIDFVCKPSGSGLGLADCADEIIEKIKIAARANVKSRIPLSNVRLNKGATLNDQYSPESLAGNIKMVAIGASTGGTEAIREVLFRLPEFSPPVVIAQHIPKEFSEPFAIRMNSISAMKVKQAEDGELIKQGSVYIAPGSHHLTVEKLGAQRFRCRLDLREPVNRHRPSVDVLFDSVVQQVGSAAIGVLLTGMGKDGAKGLKNMMDTNCPTIAQDELSSVVWGMPGEAVKIGAAEHICPLDKVSQKILEIASSKRIRQKVRVA